MRLSLVLAALLLVAIASSASTKKQHNRKSYRRGSRAVAGTSRRCPAGAPPAGKAISRRGPNSKLDDCNIDEDDDNTLFIDITSDAQWAYAGLRPNKDYFCIDQDFEDIILMYKFERSFNYTSCTPVEMNGCYFDYTDCMDPAMKQQIVDSGVCTSNAPPQQIVDQMMLQINRANWLFVAFDDFWELDFYPDDNYCNIEMDNGLFVVAAKVNVS